MYKAIFKRKNGEIRTKYISSILPFIDLSFIEDRAPSSIQEFTELTPDNIINKGGFTKVEILFKKIRYQLINQPSFDEHKDLIYKEI